MKNKDQKFLPELFRHSFSFCNHKTLQMITIIQKIIKRIIYILHFIYLDFHLWIIKVDNRFFS